MEESNTNGSIYEILKNIGPDAEIFPTLIKHEGITAKTSMSQAEAKKFCRFIFKYSEAYSGVMFPLTLLFFQDSPSEAISKILDYGEDEFPNNQILSFLIYQINYITRWQTSKENLALTSELNERLRQWHSTLNSSEKNIKRYHNGRAVIERSFLNVANNKADTARRMKVIAAQHSYDLFEAITNIDVSNIQDIRKLPLLLTSLVLILAKFAGDNAVMDGIKIQQGRLRQKKERVDKQGIVALRKHFMNLGIKWDTELWAVINNHIDKHGPLDIDGYTFEIEQDHAQDDIKKRRLKQTNNEGNEYIFSFNVFSRTKIPK